MTKAKKPAAARPPRPAKGRSKVTKAKGSGHAARDADGLTPLERRFAVEYLVDFNATRAWMRASTRKVSEPAAATAGNRALKLPAIQALVAGKAEQLTEAAELSVKDVLTKLRQMMLFDPRKLFDAKGNPIPFTELDDDTVPAIAGLDVLEEYDGVGKDRVFIGYVKKYKLIDRNSTLDKAMKYFGLFSVDNKQKADAVGALIEAVHASGSRLPIKARAVG